MIIEDQHMTMASVATQNNYISKPHIAVLVINYGVSNTIVLEMP